jgi:alpha-tubulin suppressor-like RCC1 family protein
MGHLFRRAIKRSLRLSSVIACGVVSACASKPPTAIMLGVSSEPAVPGELDRLRITVLRGEAVSFDQEYDLPDGAHVPGTLTLSPRDADDHSPLTITVRARKASSGDAWRVTRTARLGFLAERSKLLRLRLERACLDLPCSPDLTCIGGACVPPDVDPTSLPDIAGTPEGQGQPGNGEVGGSAAAGSGGAAGSAGQGGMSGASGQGGLSGASGQAGMSGASGQGGLSGASGQGGMSGASGQGGMSGAGGQGGTAGTGGQGGAACAPPTLDCDKDAANGCEVDPTGDPANCGACGAACGAGIPCDQGVCNGIVEVVAGNDHACLRTVAGEVHCWGMSDWGQIGIGEYVALTGQSAGAAFAPTRVGGLPPVAQLSAASQHTCALGTDGSVWCWGRGDAGQLGLGAPTMCGPLGCATAPVQVPSLPGPASAIAAAGAHSCAIVSSAVWCWGDNSNGQLGIMGSGTFPPGVVPSLPPVSHVVAAGTTTCAWSDGAAANCWGGNQYGQLGTGSSVLIQPNLPAPVQAALGAAVFAGSGVTCFLAPDHSLSCAGDNSGDRLGTPVPDSTPHPLPVPLTGSFSTVAVGPLTACGALVDGTVRCWGSSTYDALGYPNPACSSCPLDGSTSPAPASSVTSLAGSYAMHAYQRSGEVVSWGDNSGACLGTGTHDLASSPLGARAGPLTRWTKRLGGAGVEWATGAVAGADDSLYITGWFQNGATDLGMGPITNLGGSDGFIVKLSANGDTMWQRGLGGVLPEQTSFVAASKSDEILVGGFSAGFGSWGGGMLAAGAVLARFDANGTPGLSRSYGVAGDRAVAGGYLASGNVVAAFAFASTIDLGMGPLAGSGAANLALAELDAAGSAVWQKAIGNGTTTPTVAAIDASTGLIAVGGFFTGMASFGGPTLSAGTSGAFVAVYASDGSHQFSRAFPSSAGAAVRGVAFSPNGGLVVSGIFTKDVDLGAGAVSTPSAASDSFLIGLDAAGANLFARAGFAADAAASQGAAGVLVGDDGAITLAGGFTGGATYGGAKIQSTQSGLDIFMTAFAADGSHLWTSRTGSGVLAGGALAIDHHRGLVGVTQFGGTHSFGAEVLAALGTQDVVVVKVVPLAFRIESLCWSTGSFG